MAAPSKADFLKWLNDRPQSKAVPKLAWASNRPDNLLKHFLMDHFEDDEATFDDQNMYNRRGALLYALPSKLRLGVQTKIETWTGALTNADVAGIVETELS